MSDSQQRFSAAGLRRITVQLPRGDVRIERIDGQDVVVEAEKHISASQRDAELVISGSGPAAKRPRMEMRMGDGMRMRMGDGMEMRIDGELSGLGAQITEVVGTALDAVFGGGTFGIGDGDLRIGIPTMLELPEIMVATGSGDLACADLTAVWTLRTGSGEARLRGCGGRLTLQTGSGEIDVQGFEGPAACVSGSGGIATTKIAGRAELRTGNGEIKVDGCPAGGTVLTGAGEIELNSIGGIWSIRSGSGDIEVRVRESASLEIVTGSGDVEIAGGALTALRVQTSSGDIRCESLLVGQQHTIVSGHGDIELHLADPPGARLQVITGHGEVDSAFPLVHVGKQGPQTGVRYVGNAGESTIDVELRTSAGDIRIVRRRGDDTYVDRAATASPSRVPDRMEPAPPHPPSSPIPPAPVAPPVAPIAPHSRTNLVPLRGPAASTHPTQGADGREENLPEDRSRPVGLSDPALAIPTPDPGVPTPGAASPTPQSAAGRLAILRSLQRGEISAEEAALLLDAAERTGG